MADSGWPMVDSGGAAFEEWIFRAMFPRRHRVVVAAQALVDRPNPVDYMEITAGSSSSRYGPSPPPGDYVSVLVPILNGAAEARRELVDAVGVLPRFVEVTPA